MENVHVSLALVILSERQKFWILYLFRVAAERLYLILWDVVSELHIELVF